MKEWGGPSSSPEYQNRKLDGHNAKLWVCQPKKRNSAPVPWLILCVFSLEKLNKQIITALRTTYTCITSECRKSSLNPVKHFCFGLCQRWNHKRWWNQGCFCEGKTKYVSFLKGFFSILECWNMWITKHYHYLIICYQWISVHNCDWAVHNLTYIL